MSKQTRFVIVGGGGAGPWDRSNVNRSVRSLEAKLTAWHPDSRISVHFPLWRRPIPGIEAVGQTLVREVLEQGADNIEQISLFFFGFDLAGDLIKQAMVFAAESPEHRGLVDATMGVFIFGEFHEDNFRHRSLDISDMFPGRFLDRIRNIRTAFRAISAAFRLYYIEESDPTPELRIGTLDPLACEYFQIGRKHSGDWNLSADGPELEWISGRLDGLLTGGAEDIRAQYQNFFHRLVKFRSAEPRLRVRIDRTISRLVEPRWPPGKWISENELIREWKAESGSAILVICGETRSEATSLVPDIADSIIDGPGPSPPICYITVDVGIQHLDSEAAAANLAVSLILEILTFQPSLFQCISTLSNWVSQHSSINSPTLWTILCSLLAHLYAPHLVIALQNVGSPPSADVLSDLVALGHPNGLDVKIIISSDSRAGNWPATHHDRRLHIVDLAVVDEFIERARTMVKSKVEGLLATRPTWKSLEPTVTQKIWSGKQNHFWAMAKLHLIQLQSDDIPSTVAAMRAKMNDFPSETSQFLKKAMNQLPQELADYLRHAIIWINFAPRPLKPSELSVAVTFAQFQSADATVFSEMRDLIPSDLLGDINRRFGQWLALTDGRVVISSRTLQESLVRIIVRDPREQGLSLLESCFSYMEKARLLSPDATDALDAWQQDFLAYAAMNWPYHANDLGSSSAEMVLSFLRDQEKVSYWSSLVDRSGGSQDIEPGVYSSLLTIVAHFGLEPLVDAAVADTEERVTQGGRRAALLREAVDIAVRQGHSNIAQKLHAAPRDDWCEPPPLRLASSKGYSDLARQFIESDRFFVNPQDAEAEYYAALLDAAREGYSRTALILLRAFDQPLIEKLSRALLLACRTGQTALARELLRRGASLEVCDSDGFNALGIAIQSGFDDLVRLLVEEVGTQLGDLRPERHTALHLAAEQGHRSTCAYLISRGVPVQATNQQGETPLHVSTSAGFVDIVRFLLQNTPEQPLPDPDKPPKATYTQPVLSPLQISARKGHLLILDLLLKSGKKEAHGVSNDVEDRIKALAEAASAGQLESAVTLWKSLGTLRGDNPVNDTDGLTALQVASRDGQERLVRALLTRPLSLDSPWPPKFDVDFKGAHGMTAMHYAAKAGRVQVVACLIQHKASLKEEAPDGNLPIHLAILNDRLNVITTLQAADPTPTEVCTQMNGAGLTALALAVANQRSSIVDALLADAATQEQGSGSGASPTAEPSRSKSHKFPLHSAVASGDQNTARILVKHGFSTDLQRDDEEQYTPFHVAALSSSASMMQLLLEHGDGEIACIDKEGRTALYLAAELGDLETCEVILTSAKTPVKDFIDIPSKVPTFTPLHRASRYGHRHVVKLLLDHHANPNARGVDNWTPLHATCELSYSPTGEAAAHRLAVAILLLDAKAERDAESRKGLTALSLAASSGLDEIVELLLDRGANPNPRTRRSHSPLYRAIRKGHLRCVEKLVERGASVDAALDGLDPLHYAAALGSNHVVRYLISQGANINSLMAVSYRTPLELAIINRQTETVEILLEDKIAEALQPGSLASALQLAIMDSTGSSESIIPRLLNRLSDLNIVGGQYGTVLRSAVFANRIDVAETLVKRGARVNTMGGSGGSALAIAVKRGFQVMVRFLLGHEADPDLTTGDRNLVPAILAARYDREEILDLVIAHGADTTIQDAVGRTLLGVAVQNNSINATKFLVERVPDLIDKPDMWGRTPLMTAVLNNQHDLVHALLAANADPNVPDSELRTPLMRCMSEDALQVTIAQTLLAHEAVDLGLKDCRGRGVLYWASRIPGALSEDFYLYADVADALAKRRIGLVGQRALQAAAAMGNDTLFGMLLDWAETQENLAEVANERDLDGWSPAHTTKCYNYPELTAKLAGAQILSPQAQLATVPSPSDGSVPAQPVPPSSWHPRDHGAGLQVSDENRQSVSLHVIPEDWVFTHQHYTLIRANHPIIGGEAFYFEIKIEKEAIARNPFHSAVELPAAIPDISIGICEEHAPVHQKLGASRGSWAIHSCSGDASDNGHPSSVGEKFDAPDVVGCGVNIEKQAVFFTKNGVLLGIVFRGVKGKLFPAVSFGTQSTGCTVTANFGGSGGDKDLLYRNWKDEANWAVENFVPVEGPEPQGGSPDEDEWL